MNPFTAAPDAGAGSGPAASSKASVADQLQDVDTSVLDRLVAIRQEEARLEAFRARAGEMKGQVSDPVFRRVLEDYNKRAATRQEGKPSHASHEQESDAINPKPGEQG
jgi:hypothetical protein